MDEKRGKVGVLDRSQFSMDWHPADYGIVDAIAQTLLPETSLNPLQGDDDPASTSDQAQSSTESPPQSRFIVESEERDKRARDEHWGVKAELYQLNVSFWT